MVGTYHSETLIISGENAPLWWMTMVRMCKINGIARQTPLGKKRGVYPLPKTRKAL